MKRENREGPFERLKANEPPYRVEGASTLFIDLIGFSNDRSTENMEGIVSDLHSIIYRLASHDFTWGERKKPSEILIIPTGDGYAITFNPSIKKSQLLDWTVKLWEKIVSKHHKIRMGLHQGPNYIFTDVNLVSNVIGWGIVLANRVMSLAEENQILCSSAFAESLKPDFTDLHAVNGEYQIKHGGVIRIYNYYGKEFGNSIDPSPDRRIIRKKGK